MTDQLETPGLDRQEAWIDRSAEVSVGLQLDWALCARVRDGRLKPGQRLPGLREMAQDSGLNINTVRAVYQRLERKGLIESQQGSGTFVAPISQLRSDVATIAAGAASEARATGVDPREVAAVLYVAPKSPPSATDTGIERRRELRTQISALERTVCELEAAHPKNLPARAPERSSTAPRGRGPTLPSAAELEAIRDALVRRLAAVQSAIDARPETTAGKA
jgi:DNA-binding transcriptional regulator YhcF (GntR family)